MRRLLSTVGAAQGRSDLHFARLFEQAKVDDHAQPKQGDGGHHQLNEQGQHRIQRGAGQAGRHQQGTAGQAGRDRHAGQAKPFAIRHRRAIAQPEGGSHGTNRTRRQQRLDDGERDDLDRPLAGVATGPQAGIPHRGRVGQQLGADEGHRRSTPERGAVENVVETPPAQQQEWPGEHQ